jgi:hypothetical protein
VDRREQEDTGRDMALKAEVMMSIIIEILVTRPLLAQFTYSTLILLVGRVCHKRELTVGETKEGTLKKLRGSLYSN